MTLAVDPRLRTSLCGIDLPNVDTDSQFIKQKPYPNGVTVYKRSMWMGNGFGTEVARVAVRDGVVVGVHATGYSSFTSEVAGVGSISSDVGWMGHGKYRRSYIVKSAFNNWLDTVKAL